MGLDIRGAACAYLRNGKVTVLQAENVSGEPYRPHTVTARVEGHSAKYIVLLDDGRWTCTCDDPATCAHVAAVQLVTGHPGPARKEQR